MKINFAVNSKPPVYVRVGFFRDIPSHEKNSDTLKVKNSGKIPNPGDKNPETKKIPNPRD